MVSTTICSLQILVKITLLLQLLSETCRVVSASGQVNTFSRHVDGKMYKSEMGERAGSTPAVELVKVSLQSSSKIHISQSSSWISSGGMHVGEGKRTARNGQTDAA